MAKRHCRLSAEGVSTEQAGYRNAAIVCVPDMTETASFKLPGDVRASVIEASQTTFDDTAVQRSGWPGRHFRPAVRSARPWPNSLKMITQTSVGHQGPREQGTRPGPQSRICGTPSQE